MNKKFIRSVVHSLYVLMTGFFLFSVFNQSAPQSGPVKSIDIFGAIVAVVLGMFLGASTYSLFWRLGARYESLAGYWSWTLFVLSLAISLWLVFSYSPILSPIAKCFCATFFWYLGICSLFWITRTFFDTLALEKITTKL